MKAKKILILLVVLVMVFSTCVVHAYPMNDFIRVLPALQETNNWCWAACGQSVLDYFGRYVSQSDFCEATLGGVYDETTTPYHMRGGFRRYGVDSRVIRSYLNFDSIKTEISIRRRPILIGLDFSDRRTKHMVLANGYVMRPTGMDYVSIMDPAVGRFYLPSYDFLRGGKWYDHSWTITMCDFR